MKDDMRLQISEIRIQIGKIRIQIGNQSEISLKSEFCHLKFKDRP